MADSEDRIFAIVSDVHANYVSWRAFLKDATTQGVNKIGFLGDVMDYGPNPAACLVDVHRLCEIKIMGNHDHAVLFGVDDERYWNPHAIAALGWTKEEIKRDPRSPDLWKYLAGFKPQHIEGDYHFVHGSLRHFRDEYLTPGPHGMRYDEWTEMMEANFSLLNKFLFCGHSHLPCVINRKGERDFNVTTQTELGESLFSLHDFGQAIVNVGSLGQPRDGDPRGCYLVLNMTKGTAHFRRFEYDTTAACQLAMGMNLNGHQVALGDRLLYGQ